MSKRYALLAVPAIILLAAGLRIWGIGWGLPTDRHYFSYHPDEVTVLLSAMKVNLFAGEFDPGFYNYGSLYIFLVSIAAVFGSLFGLINLPSGDVFAKIGEIAKLYLSGRLIALALGVLTVYLVYLLGKRAYGRRTGLLAALLMAILPIHVMHSKFMAVDVPATFFITLALLFAVRIPEGHRLRDYLLSGLFAGLAAGTKYNAGLVILSPIVAHLGSGELSRAISHKARPVLRVLSPKMWAVLTTGAAGFLIGTPGAILNYGRFSHDFAFEVLHARTGHGLVFAQTGSGFVYHIVHSLWPGMGLPLMFLAGLGILYALYRRTPAGLALMAFALVYYVVIGIAQVRFARYIIPLLPVMAVLGARPVADLLNKRNWAIRYLTAIILTVAIGYTLFYSLALDRVMASTDTRDQADRWIRANVPTGSSIAFPTIPWFYTPPLDPYFGLPMPSERLDRITEVTDYSLIVNPDREWDAAFLKRESPDYVVLSEFEYADRQRIKDSAYESYSQVLKKDYRIIREFSDSPSLLGFEVPLIPKLPHDMSYPSPTILIYGKSHG